MGIELSTKQADFLLNSNAKINVSHGAVRSGKTYITNIRWLDYIQNGPPGKLLMSGRTKQSVKDNVLDDIFAIIGENNFRYNQSTGDLTIFNRKLKVVGADNIEAETKIRGQTYAGWYGDEITIQHPTFVKQAITRCSVPGAQVFWTTNPDHPRHSIKKDFIDNEEMRVKGQLKSWHFLLEDNATLSDDYKEILKASFSGVFYARNIDGLWVIAEGVVYGNDYNREKHFIKMNVPELISSGKFKYYIAGVDWGYTHPMTGLLYGVTADNEYYQIAEYYETKQKTEHLAEWFLQWERKIGKQIRVIWCDTAEPDRLLVLQEKGLKATGADKQIMAGINTVMTVFKNDKLFISDDCTNTDNELQTYRFPEEDDTKFKTGQPLDEDNHAMDGKRYAIHNHEKYLLGQRNKEEKKKERSDRKKDLKARMTERRNNRNGRK